MLEHKIDSDAQQVTHDCCAGVDTGQKERLTARTRRGVGGKEPRIELLYFEGCPTYKLARQIIAEVLAVTGVVSDVRVINVTSEAQARQLKFIGSPTVRVDDRDVEPNAEVTQQYGLKCRIYSVAGKLNGCPSPEMVLTALREAGYVA